MSAPVCFFIDFYRLILKWTKFSDQLFVEPDGTASLRHGDGEAMHCLFSAQNTLFMSFGIFKAVERSGIQMRCDRKRGMQAVCVADDLDKAFLAAIELNGIIAIGSTFAVGKQSEITLHHVGDCPFPDGMHHMEVSKLLGGILNGIEPYMFLSFSTHVLELLPSLFLIIIISYVNHRNTL